MSHQERSGHETVSISQTLMFVIFDDIFITWMTIYLDNKCCFHTITVYLIISVLNLTYQLILKLQLLFFHKFKINLYLKPHTFNRTFTLTKMNVPFTEDSTTSYCWFFFFFFWQNKIFKQDWLLMQKLEYDWISCI